MFFVYLYADEKIIRQREEVRGDGLPGLAVHWMNVFDHQDDCDLCLDTGSNSTELLSDRVMSEILKRG